MSSFLTVDHKALLRKKVKSLRNNISQQKKNDWDKSILSILRTYVIQHGFKSVNCFVGSNSKGEIDTKPFIIELLKNNITVTVPYMVDNKNMQMAQIVDLNDLAPNQFDILEPVKPRFINSPPEISIVPLLAADQHNNRLGYGAGYYDRYLSKYSTVKTVGLVYQCFIFEKLPTEFHDIPLDLIISEETILK